MGWAALPKPVSEYRRKILRPTGAYTNGDSHSNSYANCDTDVYATSNTYTKNSSNTEGSTHAPAAPVAYVDEKETHYSVGFLSSAGFAGSACVRGCGLFDVKRSAAFLPSRSAGQSFSKNAHVR